ncbi:hypothetical protein C8F01DRAFT_1228111 [Mycena amicta]|nr:hypothetical protein C8F01DRAFT_1228111 [Mycena amicta]
MMLSLSGSFATTTRCTLATFVLDWDRIPERARGLWVTDVASTSKNENENENDDGTSRRIPLCLIPSANPGSVTSSRWFLPESVRTFFATEAEVKALPEPAHTLPPQIGDSAVFPAP